MKAMTIGYTNTQEIAMAGGIAEWLAGQDPRLGAVDWDKYRGNNHHVIPAPEVRLGGAVSFGKHIGKPLSLALWQDLIHRFCINGLCIYNPNQAQWTVGWGPGHCIIQLLADGTVGNISLTPYGRRS